MAKLTLAGWNDLLTQINVLAASPPGGCSPLAPLPLVEDPHKWSVDDVNAARERLLLICDDNSFITPVVKWTQAIIDEFIVAIGVGWCGCSGGSCENEVTIPLDISSYPESWLADIFDSDIDLWRTRARRLFKSNDIDSLTVFSPISPNPPVARYWVLTVVYTDVDPHYPVDPSEWDFEAGSINSSGEVVSTGDREHDITTKKRYAVAPPDWTEYSASPQLSLHARCVSGVTTPSVLSAGTYESGSLLTTISLATDSIDDWAIEEADGTDVSNDFPIDYHIATNGEVTVTTPDFLPPIVLTPGNTILLGVPIRRVARHNPTFTEIGATVVLHLTVA